MTSRPDINSHRLIGLIEELARFGAKGAGVDRQALTHEEGYARQFLIDWARRHGCSIATDAIGNLFFRREGRENIAPVLTGSHIDTQPDGGQLDGAYGVCAGLEVLATLHSLGITTRRSIEVVAWTNEEGCRFAPGSMGASAFVEPARLGQLLASVDSTGISVLKALAEINHLVGDGIPTVPLARPVAAYLEAHIEQGPVLEAAGKRIGAVTGIQGVRWFRVHINGESAHAGTTPRSQRRDAVAIAAPMIGTLLDLMLDDDDLRLTIGSISVEPNAINSIPGKVQFSIDLRHPSADALDKAEERLRDIIGRVPVAHIDELMRSDGVIFDPDLLALVEQSASARSLPRMRLPSGAFHDALHLADYCPSAMIFVPSCGGISHNPAEHTDPDDLTAGANVLLDLVVDLAER
jgi:N-carbamoyl-L-amino-acid hydrolase